MNRRLLACLLLICPAVAWADPATAPTSRPSIVNTQPTTAPTDGSDVIAPTMITLNLKNASVEDALKQLSTKSGYALRPFNLQFFRMRGMAANSKITASYNNQPFWDVVLDLCQQGQVTPYFDGAPGRQILFMPSQMGMSIMNCPRSIDGSCMTLLTMIMRQQTVSLTGNNTRQDDFTAQMLVRTEPKVKVLSYSSSPEITQAVDDLGNSLASRERNTGRTQLGGMMMMRSSQLNMSIALRYPPKTPGKKIARLAGLNHFTVATHVQSLEFTDFKKDKAQTRKSPDGISMTVESCKPDPGMNPNAAGNGPQQYLVKFKLSRGGLSVSKFNELRQNLDLRLVDDAGHELMFQGQRESSGDNNELRQTVMFFRPGPNDMRDATGVPAKLIWDVSTESKDVAVPFEFKNVPMP